MAQWTKLLLHKREDLQQPHEIRTQWYTPVNPVLVMGGGGDTRLVGSLSNKKCSATVGD